MTRTGKVARLPHEIRELLNQKLLDGIQGRQLVDWLNGLPEVQEVMIRDFDGRAISEQNLTEWKQGGFRQWFAQEEARLCSRVLAVDAGELTEAAGGSVADHLATVIAAKYAVAIAGWDGEPDPVLEKTLRTLGEICRNLEELRRGDHSAARVRLEQARVTLAGSRVERHILEKFRDWLTQKEGWKYMSGGEGFSEEQQFERFYKILTGKQVPELSPDAAEGEVPTPEPGPPP